MAHIFERETAELSPGVKVKEQSRSRSDDWMVVQMIKQEDGHTTAEYPRGTEQTSQSFMHTLGVM